MMTMEVAAGEAVKGHIRRALRELAQLDGMSAALGGLVSPRGDALTLSELHRLGSCQLRGVVIRPGIGLGGLALQRRRPVMVDDYVGSDTITHQFDRAVTADRISSAVALPVFVRGAVGAVIYGATRGSERIGERTVATASVMARKLGHDVEVEELVQLRLRRVLDEREAAEQALLSQSERSGVHAELISIAATVADAALRQRLLDLSRQLTGSSGGQSARVAVRLSQRESDVLSQLAAGYTNAEIAERLSIGPTTVKTHLRNTMRKLGARNRVETLSAARHAGLLP